MRFSGQKIVPEKFRELQNYKSNLDELIPAPVSVPHALFIAETI